MRTPNNPNNPPNPNRGPQQPIPQSLADARVRIGEADFETGQHIDEARDHIHDYEQNHAPTLARLLQGIDTLHGNDLDTRQQELVDFRDNFLITHDTKSSYQADLRTQLDAARAVLAPQVPNTAPAPIITDPAPFLVNPPALIPDPRWKAEVPDPSLCIPNPTPQPQIPDPNWPYVVPDPRDPTRAIPNPAPQPQILDPYWEALVIDPTRTIPNPVARGQVPDPNWRQYVPDPSNSQVLIFNNNPRGTEPDPNWQPRVPDPQWCVPNPTPQGQVQDPDWIPIIPDPAHNPNPRQDPNYQDNIPNPLLGNITAAELAELRQSITDLSNRRAELDPIFQPLTDARNAITAAIQQIEAQRLLEQQGRRQAQSAVDAIFAADFDRINRDNPRLAHGLQQYNRHTVARMIVGFGLTAMNSFPGAQPFGLLARGIMAVGGAAAGGDALATNKIEQSGLTFFQDLINSIGPQGFVTEANAALFLRTRLLAAPAADRERLMQEVLRSYGQLTYITSARGLKIDAGLAETEHQNRVAQNTARSQHPIYGMLDRARERVGRLHPAARVMIGLGIGVGAGLTAALTGGASVVAGMAVNGAWGVVNTKKMESREEYSRQSGILQAMRTVISELSHDPNYQGIIENHVTNQVVTVPQTGQVMFDGAIGQARFEAKEKRKNTAGGFALAALALQGIMGGAKLWHDHQTASTAAAGTTAPLAGAPKPMPVPNMPDQSHELPKESLHLMTTEQVNSWRVAHGLPALDHASLHMEGATTATGHSAAHNLAVEVVKGEMGQTGQHYTPAEQAEAERLLIENWKQRGIFNPDGSLNEAMRNNIRFESQGGINGLGDAEKAFHNVQEAHGRAAASLAPAPLAPSPLTPPVPAPAPDITHPPFLAPDPAAPGFHPPLVAPAPVPSVPHVDPVPVVPGHGGVPPVPGHFDVGYSPAREHQLATDAIHTVEVSEAKYSPFMDGNDRLKVDTAVTGYLDKLVQSSPNREVLLQRLHDLGEGVHRIGEYNMTSFLPSSHDAQLTQLSDSGFAPVINAAPELGDAFSRRIALIYQNISSAS